MKIQTFRTREDFEKWWEEQDPEKIHEKVECKVFEGYEKSRVLIIAPHAGTAQVEVGFSNGSVKRYIGDRNTDVLAKVAAFNIGGAVLVSYVPRTEADFARDPEKLGEGISLNVSKIVNGSKVKVQVPIHRNPEWYGVLSRFHQKIEELDPMFILSYHGLGYTSKAHVVLGFGRNSNYIGGEENARMFVESVRKIAREMNLNYEIKKASIFSGSSEWNLASHVRNRFGVLVEFNFWLRKDFPGEEAQKLGTAIAMAAVKWIRGEKK